MPPTSATSFDTRNFNTKQHDMVHPRNLTWNLKMMVFNRNLLFQGFIFRFHVSFQGVYLPNGTAARLLPPGQWELDHLWHQGNLHPLLRKIHLGAGQMEVIGCWWLREVGSWNPIIYRVFPEHPWWCRILAINGRKWMDIICLYITIVRCHCSLASCNLWYILT